MLSSYLKFLFLLKLINFHFPVTNVLFYPIPFCSTSWSWHTKDGCVDLTKLRRHFNVLCNNIVIINYTDSHTYVVYLHCYRFIYFSYSAEISCIRLYLNQVSFVVRYRKISYTELVY